MRLTSWVRLLATGPALALVAGLVIALPAPAATGAAVTEPPVTSTGVTSPATTYEVEDVPVPVRHLGRAAQLHGSSDEGFLLVDEVDGARFFPASSDAPRRMPVGAAALLSGDRVVAPPNPAATDAEWRIVPVDGGPAETVPVPAADGSTLLSVGSADRLVEGPWSDGAPGPLTVVDDQGTTRPVTGLPGTGWRPSGPVHDNLVLLTAFPNRDAQRYVLHTPSGAAAPMPEPFGGMVADSFVADGSTAAWLETVGGLELVVAERGDGPALGRTVRHPLPDDLSYPGPGAMPTLVVAGSSVYVTAPRWTDGVGREVRELVAYDLDGSQRSFGPAGTATALDGDVLTVRVGEGADTTVERLGKDPVTVLSLPGIPVTFGHAAVDGRRLLYAGADSVWEWDVPADVELGAPRRLFADPYGVRDVASDGVNTTVGASDGLRRLNDLGASAPVSRTVANAVLHRTSERFALVRDRSGSTVVVVDLLADAPVSRYYNWDGGDLQGDTLWRAGWPGNVVAEDLESGRTRAWPVGGNCTPGAPQVAGRWLVTACGGGAEPNGVLVDLKNLAPRALVETSSETVVGDGVALRVVDERNGADVSVQWLDFRQPGAGWRELDRIPAAQPRIVPSVSQQGPLVTAAWPRGDDTIRLVRFSSEPSAAATTPTGPSTPPAPATAVTAQPRQSAVGVSWSHTSGSDASSAEGFVVTATTTRPPGTARRTVVPSPARSAVVTGLVDGEPYRVTVTTHNGAGDSGPVSAAATVTPRRDAPYPPVATVKVDPRTDLATVSWGLNLVPGWAPPTHLSVQLGSTVLAKDVPATSRSVTVRVPAKGEQTLSVYTWNGPHRSTANLAGAVFPGTDTKAPAITGTTLPAVTLTGSATYAWTGSDDRGVASYDVRLRSATSGSALGTWQYPGSWQKRTGGSQATTLKAGVTSCLSVRARDWQGNVSGWTAQRCTAMALDQGALAKGGKWTTQNSPKYYFGSLLSTTSKGATLQRSGTRTDAVWVVATTCPTCGSVEVLDDGVRIATVSLKSSTSRYKALVAVPLGGKARAGVITLRAAGTAPVLVDGLALRSY